MSIRSTVIACIAMLAGLTHSANASTVLFNDLSDTIVGTSDVTGGTFGPSITTPAFEELQYFNSAVPQGGPIVNILEGPPIAGELIPVSDTIGALPGVITFASDGTSELPTGAFLLPAGACSVPGTICITETGAPQDVTALLFPVIAPSFHVLFESDVVEAAVPEPATFAIFAAGLVGLLAFRRRDRFAR